MKILYKGLINIMLVLFFILFDACHQKKIDNDITPAIESKKSIYRNFLIKDQSTDLGFVVMDTLQREIALAFGDKNTNGVLKRIKKIIYWIPEKKASLNYTLTPDYLLSEVVVTTEMAHKRFLFTNYDLILKKVSLSIIDGETGKVDINNQEVLLDENTIATIKTAQNNGQIVASGGRIAAQADCDILNAALKSSIKIFSCSLQAFATYTAILAVLAAPETGGLSLFLAYLAIYSELIACEKAGEAVKKIVDSNCDTEVDVPEDVKSCITTLARSGNLKRIENCIGPLVDILRKFLENPTDPNKPQPSSPSSTGGGFGDPHIRTMDGLYYDFQGYGEFIAVKSVTDNFEIQVRQEQIAPYLNHQVTMNTCIAVNTGNDKVCVYPDRVYINNTQYGFGNVVVSLTKGNVSYSNGLLTIVSDNEDVIKINVQSLSPAFLDYTVTLNNNRKGKVKGLLGNFDGVSSNDKQTQTGNSIDPYTFSSIYPTYADSWRIDQNNSLFFYVNGSTTSTYTKKDFPKSQIELDAAARLQAETICRQRGVNEDPFLSACIMDVALTGSDKYAVSAVGAQEFKSIIKNFSITKFASFSENDLTPFGNAEIVDGLMYLTRNKDFQVSAVYKKYKVDITTGFETSFDFSMSGVGGIKDTRNRVGADGIVFVIQDFSSKNVPLASGVGLGYDGLPRSLAVEFDTYNNGSQENQDDISLNTQGVSANSVNDSRTLIKAQTRQLPIMNDGKVHNVVIRYTKKSDESYRLEAFFDKDTSPYLTADNINIQKKIGAYGTGVYIGLTSATGYSWENHIIHNWSFKPL